jgi:hypothetical protein
MENKCLRYYNLTDMLISLIWESFSHQKKNSNRHEIKAFVNATVVDSEPLVY